MSIAAVNLTGGIRVDQDAQKGSMSYKTFARITRNNPELNPKWVKLRIDGRAGRSRWADSKSAMCVHAQTKLCVRDMP